MIQYCANWCSGGREPNKFKSNKSYYTENYPSYFCIKIDLEKLT